MSFIDDIADKAKDVLGLKDESIISDVVDSVKDVASGKSTVAAEIKEIAGDMKIGTEDIIDSAKDVMSGESTITEEAKELLAKSAEAKAEEAK